MTDLYSEKDLQQISAQLKKRYAVLFVILAVLLGLFIYSLIIRKEWMSIVLFALIGFIAVFVIDLFCLPLQRYKKLVLSALSGRTHTDSLIYDRQESESSLVDGVHCLGLIFLGEPDKHGTREQRFYWDQEIPLPAFQSGSQVTLKYTGKNIIGYEL